MSLFERFWSKVKIGDPDACWPWMAGKFGNDYGAFSVDGKLVRAHRFMFALVHGPIAAGVRILHRCDNPPCCNPWHLFAGSDADNVRDRDQKGRTARGERQGRAKLTDELIRMIRTDSRGARPVAISFGVARSLVQRIRQGRLWTHVN